MAKQPQDHKPKTEKAKAVEAKFEIDGREVDGWEVTHRGFTVKVPREAFNDFELLDDMASVQDMKPARIPALLRRIVGNDFRIVMDGLRDKTTGRVDITAATVYVKELMEAVYPNG